ncbi:MAG: protease modulator HflC [Alphaproteobacteria bacterium]|jgi:membrane protease subunit HflC
MRRSTLIVLAIALLIIVIGAASSLFTVHQAQQAIVLQFGDPKRVISDPGLNVKIPFVQNIERFDKRILNYDGPAEEIIAADQKRLVVDTFTRYRIVDPLKFFISVQTQAVAETRLGPIVNSSLRRVLGEVPLSSVLTDERPALMAEITRLVGQQTENLGIEVVDVRIKRADLPSENSQAIFRRMQREREREAAEFRAQGAEQAQRIRAIADRERVVILAQAQRDAQILRGEGDARRNKIFADAFGQDPEFFSFYRSMLAYENTLASEDTSMVLSPQSEFFRYFQDFERSLFPDGAPQ